MLEKDALQERNINGSLKILRGLSPSNRHTSRSLGCLARGTADPVDGEDFCLARSAKPCLKAVFVALVIDPSADPFRVEVESVRAGSAWKVGVWPSARSAAPIVGGVVALTLGTDEPLIELEAVRAQEVAFLSLCNVEVAGLTLGRRTLANAGGGVED